MNDGQMGERVDRWMRDRQIDGRMNRQMDERWLVENGDGQNEGWINR